MFEQCFEASSKIQKLSNLFYYFNFMQPVMTKADMIVNLNSLLIY